MLDLVVGLYGQPRLYVYGAVHHAGDSLIDIAVALEHTVVVEVGAGHVEVGLLVAPAEGEIVMLHDCSLVGLLKPVRVGLEVPVAVDVLHGDTSVFEIVLDEFLGIHDLRDLVEALGGQLVAVADLAVALAPSGGDE